MPSSRLPIEDAVAEASSVLGRARLDGLDEVALPYADRYVQAWRGGVNPSMDAEMLVNVVKVRGSQAPCTPRAIGG